MIASNPIPIKSIRWVYNWLFNIVYMMINVYVYYRLVKMFLQLFFHRSLFWFCYLYLVFHSSVWFFRILYDLFKWIESCVSKFHNEHNNNNNLIKFSLEMINGFSFSFFFSLSIFIYEWNTKEEKRMKVRLKLEI